jgi:hypothetical protein
MTKAHFCILIGALFPGLALASNPPRALQEPAGAKTQSHEESQKDNSKIQTTQEKQKIEKFRQEAQKKSPSFQEKKWTGSQGSYESTLAYNYVAPASSNLGNGQNKDLNEHYFNFEHEFMRHTLLAFLVGVGLQYEHVGLGVPAGGWIPDRLDTAVSHVAIDFRWSEKDLLHLEGHPGFYTDFQGAGWNSFNTPFDLGYTRVVNQKLQWVVGFSLNTWRHARYLGAAGFRWQINDRWKLKAYLPTPDVEYVALPNLTLTLGADIRGDTYRVGPRFGESRGAPILNNALVDYEEVRVGPGFSWNVRPTIEFNLMTGYMVGRQFDYHTGGPKLNGSGSPFISINLHALFKLPGEQLIIPQRGRISMRNIFKYF